MKRKIDKDDLISIVKGTIRGKVAAVFFVIGIISFLGNISSGFGSAVSGLFFSWLFAYFFIASVYSGQVKREEKEKADRAKAKIEKIKETSTKRIGDYLYVNESKQTWCVPSAGPTEYAFTDLIDFSVVQDEEVISSASLLNTVAGGAVFGLAGALVGANKTKTSKTCSKLQVQMNVNSISNPVIRIDLLPYEVKRSDDRYKKALETMEEITGVLRVIKSRNQH